MEIKQRKVRKKRIIKNKLPFDTFDGTGSWHRDIKPIKIDNCILIIKGMITGCGLAQIYGVSGLTYVTISKQDFKSKFNDLRINGVGAILCTLGRDFYNHSTIKYENKLLELGFEQLSEYANYRHGQDGHYKQRLYILKL